MVNEVGIYTAQWLLCSLHMPTPGDLPYGTQLALSPQRPRLYADWATIQCPLLLRSRFFLAMSLLILVSGESTLLAQEKTPCRLLDFSTWMVGESDGCNCHHILFNLDRHGGHLVVSLFISEDSSSP
jgi:hypothetical protein